MAEHTEGAMTRAEATAIADRRRNAATQLKRLIVDRLELPMPPEWITDDQPLFGRGLELDSLDALELAVGVEYYLDVSIDDRDVGVFGSINAIIDFMEERGIEMPQDMSTTRSESFDDLDFDDDW